MLRQDLRHNNHAVPNQVAWCVGCAVKVINFLCMREDTYTYLASGRLPCTEL